MCSTGCAKGVHNANVLHQAGDGGNGMVTKGARLLATASRTLINQRAHPHGPSAAWQEQHPMLRRRECTRARRATITYAGPGGVQMTTVPPVSVWKFGYLSSSSSAIVYLPSRNVHVSAIKFACVMLAWSRFGK
jgi:hypothetical protein